MVVGELELLVGGRNDRTLHPSADHELVTFGHNVEAVGPQGQLGLDDHVVGIGLEDVHRRNPGTAGGGEIAKRIETNNGHVLLHGPPEGGPNCDVRLIHRRLRRP